MMASRIKRRRSYFLLTESSDPESYIPIYRKEKLKRITVGQSSSKEFCNRSADEDCHPNSGPRFINRKDNSVVRTAIKDKNAMFKSRNKENTCRANVKPVKENKGKYNKRLIYSRSNYNLDEDSYDSSGSSDDDSSGRKNKVEVMGSSRKIDNRTNANKHDALHSVVTSTPFPQNKQENTKNRVVVTNIRHRIKKMVGELKYMLSEFKLEVQRFQMRYLEDEIVTEQDGEDIMYTYNSMINKLKKKLNVQQRTSMHHYHQSGETKADSLSPCSEIFSENYKRPEVIKISKPNVTNNVNKQPLEANCTSASVVTVEKINNTTSKSDQGLKSLLHRLTEINVVKTSSPTSVAGSISTVRSVPDLEVLNRAYKKTIDQATTKQDSLRNGRVKEKGLLTNYDSDVNSTCSTITLCPRRNGNVKINNCQGGLIHAGTNKNVWSRDGSNRDVSNRDVSNKDVSNRDVSNREVSNRDVSKSLISDVSSEDGEVSDEIPLTCLYSSDSEATLIISNNKIRNLKHSSKDHIPAKGNTVLTSSNSKDIRPKQRSEFIVPDINNMSTNYRSHPVAISNRADYVPESKPTEQKQCNTRVDKKLRMNCQVVIEKFRITR